MLGWDSWQEEGQLYDFWPFPTAVKVNISDDCNEGDYTDDYDDANELLPSPNTWLSLIRTIFEVLGDN